jgi:hypothetical protein
MPSAETPTKETAKRTKSPARFHVLELIDLKALGAKPNSDAVLWELLTVDAPVTATTQKGAIKLAAKAETERREAEAEAAGSELPAREGSPTYWAVPADKYVPRKRTVKTLEIDQVD